ncbi:MAG: AraC family transcriptional regulator [Lachnospiraceae bacterium]|nr:AraC family transcriptional regulator [Lachnospiraceae bacterium]MDE6992469.1 AraC family transcriptional regulator [Lachnospiraceae bacterium]MDE7001380.1 AraC family transcriptional regulator [Lachnospiraceae bacterium]
MPKKKKKPAEFRFYEIPQDESVLALMGSKWIQVYGENIDNMHFHNLLEIGYCHYGDGDLVIEDDMYRFDAGMISCIPANYLHVTKSDADVRAFWEYIYISPEDIVRQWGKSAQEVRQILDAVGRKSFFVRVEECPAIAALIRAIFVEMQHRSAHYRECVRGMAYALLFEIARFNDMGEGQSVGKSISLQLGSAIEYVDKNYPNNFKIADLANECHMSETHFRRIFQEKMNMTPVEYVNFVRVRKACELIDKTDISMEDVAEKVGFVTPSTFNRNFRRIIGTSPYQWKKRPDNHEGRLLEYKISALKGW